MDLLVFFLMISKRYDEYKKSVSIHHNITKKNFLFRSKHTQFLQHITSNCVSIVVGKTSANRPAMPLNDFVYLSS